MENAVTKREKISYGLYFMGQNVFYGLIGYMTTYFTDIGITAALVAIVALITKVWDAINDPIFGMIMDKVNFKKGKFLPWLQISVIAPQSLTTQPLYPHSFLRISVRRYLFSEAYSPFILL